jgi:hypothetical protein
VLPDLLTKGLPPNRFCDHVAVMILLESL